LRKLGFLATVFAILSFATLASAQQGDAMIGFGTLLSSGSCNNFTLLCPEKGGLYPNVGADVIFHKRLGVAFDVAWRGGQGEYGGPGGQPYRPVLFDFNGDYQPRITKKLGADLLAGIGWQSTRYYGYQNTVSCNYFYACYVSSNHFLIDVGAGLRYYFFGHAFIRPEFHYYYINNNTADFTSNNVFRVGASIGYTIGPD
jgi:Outer membrane protein beta-barrel domain